jgi:hypothetical protein
MKRILLSVLGGFVIPFVYSVIAGHLSAYLGHNSFISSLLYIPIGFPRYIYFYIFPPLSGHWFVSDVNETAFFLYILFSLVLVYSIVSYFLLWLFSIVRKRKNVSQSPLSPPVFTNEK